MFEVGQYLRKRYNNFLGPIYHPDEVKVVTSDINRTKMTAQLITSGLYPTSPKQQWHTEQNWQPIPYTCTSQSHKVSLQIFSYVSSTAIEQIRIVHVY